MPDSRNKNLTQNSGFAGPSSWRLMPPSGMPSITTSSSRWVLPMLSQISEATVLSCRRVTDDPERRLPVESSKSTMEGP